MMGIRPLASTDVAEWDRLAREAEELVSELLADPAIFFDGFDLYMEAKIRQGEAFMALEPSTGICLGIVAFSRKHNRITFLGAFRRYDFAEVGSLLLRFALDQLDPTRPITGTVLQSTHPSIVAEMRLYQSHGFAPCGETVEAGVNATVMRLTTPATPFV